MQCLNSVTFLPISHHVGTWQFAINDAVTYILILDNHYVCVDNWLSDPSLQTNLQTYNWTEEELAWYNPSILKYNLGVALQHSNNYDYISFVCILKLFIEVFPGTIHLTIGASIHKVDGPLAM